MHWVLILVAVFFASISAILLWSAIDGMAKASRARAWPSVPATLKSVELKENTDSDGSTYGVLVDYAYTVGNRTYGGSTLSYGYSASSGQEAHAQIYHKLQNARIVGVRYNPDQPEESTIGYGINRAHMIQMGFALTWTLFTVGFFGACLAFASNDRRLLEAIEVIERAV
jgi:hypothetical protein